MTTREKSVACGAGVRLVRGREMQTRDGVCLISDHYFPPGEGPFPTLLMRQPYGRDIASTVVYAHPVWFAQRGYNVVIQDVRGRGDSEGSFYPFRYEAKDGADAINWVAGLPECNGKVGMYGFSYQGSTQLLAATEQPPALKAISPGMTAGDLFSGWFYHGGMFKLAGGMGWANQMLREDAIRLGAMRISSELERAWSDLGGAYGVAPYGTAAHLTAAAIPGYYRDWVEHDLSGSYWADLDVSTRWEKIQVPALHMMGWYDMFGQGSFDTYLQLSRKAGSEQARVNQYLIAGPWLHIPWARQIGEIDFGEQAVLPTDALLLQWFDHWLKDKPIEYKKVQLFTMGRNAWQQADALPETRERLFYLTSLGRANSLNGDGGLEPLAPGVSEMTSRDVLVVDPAVPVGSPGPGGASGAYRQNRVESGNNVLVYTSVPLENELWICGQPRVKLFIQSSSGECDVVVKLVRVDLHGAAWNITLGAARAKWLFGDADLGSRLAMDEIRTWEFALEATSIVFSKGERVRLEIAGNCFPLLDRSSGRIDVEARDAGPTNWRRVTHQVIHESDHASLLILPEVAS